MFTKKLLHNLQIVVFATVIMIFYSCGKKETTESKSTTKENTQEVDNHSKPIGTISVKTAKAWEKAYTESLDVESIKGLDYEFNREFYFPLDRMKKYIKYFEKQAKKNNYKNLGLRVYIGVRPPKGDEKHSQETIFIAPTATNVNKTNGAKLFEQNDNIYTIEPMNLVGSGRPPKSY